MCTFLCKYLATFVNIENHTKSNLNELQHFYSSVYLSTIHTLVGRYFQSASLVLTTDFFICKVLGHHILIVTEKEYNPFLTFNSEQKSFFIKIRMKIIVSRFLQTIR